MKIYRVNNKSIRNVLIAVAAAFVLATPAAATHDSQGPSGGTGGSGFSDWCSNSERVHELRIRSGSWIDAVQVSCIGTNGVHRLLPQRGGNGGGSRTIVFSPGEDVASITGYYSNYVRYMRIRTTKGRVFTYGKPQGRYFSYYKPSVSRFSGLRGASGRYVDSLGAIWR